MFQLRRKLMNMMDNEYQGRDGIMDEASNEKEQENMSRFEHCVTCNHMIILLQFRNLT